MQYECIPHQATQLQPGVRWDGCRQECTHTDQGCPLRLWLAEEHSGARVQFSDHALLRTWGPSFKQNQAGHLVGQCAEKSPQDEHQGQGDLWGALCLPTWLVQPSTGEPFPYDFPLTLEKSESKLCKVRMVWKLCRVLLADWGRLFGKWWVKKT